MRGGKEEQQNIGGWKPSSPLEMMRRAKQWSYKNKGNFDTFCQCFLSPVVTVAMFSFSLLKVTLLFFVVYLTKVLPC